MVSAVTRRGPHQFLWSSSWPLDGRLLDHFPLVPRPEACDSPESLPGWRRWRLSRDERPVASSVLLVNEQICGANRAFGGVQRHFDGALESIVLAYVVGKTAPMPTPETSNDVPHAPASAAYSPRASDESVRKLADAVAHLEADGQYMVDALIEMVLTLRPITKTTMSADQRDSLIESGTFSEERLAAVEAKVERGSLALKGIESGLSMVVRTSSLEATCAYLDWDERTVRAAVSEGRLYAFEIAGRPRFPNWQFHRAAPDGLLPYLAELIALVSPRWTPQLVNGFMETSQAGLIAKGPMRPAEYLITTGDFEGLRASVESDRWW